MDTWGVLDDVYCAGNDSTFKFLENVLDEVMQLFPSKYIHIGGDECPKERWKACPVCQLRIKNEKLKDEHALQSYFIQRIEKYLNSKGRKIIGWDEILEGGLAPNATVMSWRGTEGGIAAAKENHDVIMTPGSHCYLDHSQTKNEDSVTIGGYLPLEKVYSYEPIPEELNAEQAKYILGAQGNVWTEYMSNPAKVEYMIFPRMMALSEVLWSPREKRNWKDFERRLPRIFERLDEQKINYSKAYYDPRVSISPTPDHDGILLSVTSKSGSPSYYFGNRTESQFLIYKDSINAVIKKPGTYGIRMLGKLNPALAPEKWGNAYLSPFETIFSTDIQLNFNKATGKKITLSVPPHKSYPGDGAFTLVNGVQNEKGLVRSNEFLGFLNDVEATIDLGSSLPCSSVSVHALRQQGSWIWQPSAVAVFYSNDGTTFRTVGMTDEFQTKNGSNGITTVTFTSTEMRYVRVIIQSHGTIPDGSPGSGNPAWLFVDEIEVN
jgi:hexosaminidase